MRPRGSAEAPTGRLAPDRDSLRAARDSARRDSLRADSAATDSAARDSTRRDSSGAGHSRSKPLVRPTKPPPKKA
jgi:hypothetical protein